jgi:hypothetical protein
VSLRSRSVTRHDPRRDVDKSMIIHKYRPRPAVIDGLHMAADADSFVAGITNNKRCRCGNDRTLASCIRELGPDGM